MSSGNTPGNISASHTHTMKVVTGLLVLCCTLLCASCISINNLITLRDLRRGYCRGVRQIPRQRFGRALSGALGRCFSSPPEVKNAEVGEEFRVDGVPTVTVTCNRGYLFPDMSAKRNMTYECEKWRGQENCGAVFCEAPNAASSTNEPDDETFPHLATVQVTCNPGLVLQRDGTSTTYTAECTAQGVWNNTETCTTQICNAEPRNNTKLRYGSLPDLLYGTTLTVNCADGFLTSTAETSYDVTCEAGGVWNDTDSCAHIAADACPRTAVYNTMQTGGVIPFSVEDTVETVTCTGTETIPDGSTTYDATCEGGAWDNTWSCGIRTCQDTRDSSLPSGVYKIYPDTAMTEMEVYCENVYDGGGWTVIQQRVDLSVDFNRPWDNYTAGFGDPNGNFWLGLENMHLLTGSAGHRLTFILEDANEGVAYAHYDAFSIGNEASMYQLSVGSYTAGIPDVTNSFRFSNNEAFSTYDMDNDGGTNNCAIRRSGAWWFPSNCGRSNLNGVYYPTGLVEGVAGLYWRNFPAAVGVDGSLIFSRMLVKLVSE